MGKRKKKRAPSDAGPSIAPAPLEAPLQPPAALEPPERAARNRRLANALIALLLAYQLAMPLSYYLGERGLDERFSWRMFSSVRMLDCKAAVEDVVREGEQTRVRAVDLRKEVQVAWIGLLERGRMLVVEKLLARRCEQPDLLLARYRLRCTAPDGAKWPDIDRHMRCDVRVLDEGAGAP